MPSTPARLLLAAAPALQRHGEPAVPLAPRDGLLLAWLAIEGPTPRTRLAALLWPQADAGAARNALRQRLFQLRRLAGFELITGQATLSLAAGTTHDLDEADDILAGWEPGIGGDVEPWLSAQRTRRQERLRQALGELAAMAEAAQDWDDALTHARELLVIDPLSEAAHRRLIRLHYLAGDRTAALRAFDACEQALKHEVGIAPSPETLALLATVEAAARPARVVPVEVPAALSRPPWLLGREAERQRLLQTLRDRQVLLLRAEAGMGKSRLLAELGLSGSSGVSVGARPGDATVAYAVASRWLRAVMAACGLQPADSVRPVLAGLLPKLGPAGPTQAGELAAAVHRTFDDAVAGGLTAVLLDDLQFADAPSLALLLTLAERGDAAWVVAMRPAELDAAAQDFCAALERRSSTQTLDLAPLTPAMVGSLLDKLDLHPPRDPSAAVTLHAHTGGNPLYLLETLKAAYLLPHSPASPSERWPVAANVLRLIQQRLARLSAPALRLARCASVAGQDFSPELASAVLAVPVLELADAWAELESAQVLQGSRFAHDLIAEAAAATVPAALARSLHVEVATWLEAHDGEPARVADHWLSAGAGLRAVPALIAAGRQASRLWQPQAAADLHERAGELLRDAGRRREAFDAYLCAAEAWSSLRVDERLSHMAAQLEALGDDDVQRAWAACVRITLLAAERRFAEARAAADRALALARQSGTEAADAEVELLWTLAALDWDRRELVGALRHAEAALKRLDDVRVDTQRIDMSGTRLKLMHALGVFHGSLGRYAESDRWLEQAIEFASRQRGRRSVLNIAFTLASNALQQGDGRRALDWTAEALAADDRDDADQNVRAITLATSAAIHACSGQPGAALDLAERAVALCDRRLVRHDVMVRWRLAHLHAELGRRDLALRAWRSLAARDDLHGPDRPRVQAALLGAGEALPPGPVLDSIVALDDFSLRAALLCEAQPGCQPGLVLPLLAVSAATARDQGARGLWLALQARRAAALCQAGRLDEAHDIARLTWPLVEDGVVGMEWFSRIGPSLANAFCAADPRMAEVVAHRTQAWLHAAAATLPPLWRDSFLRGAAERVALPLQQGRIG